MGGGGEGKRDFHFFVVRPRRVDGCLENRGNRVGLGRVLKLYYLCVTKKIPPAPLKKGENPVKVPLKKGDLGGSPGRENTL
jgi:hypothetical protein